MTRESIWRRVPLIDLCTEHVDCVNRTAPVVREPTPFKMIRTTNVRNGFIDVENVRHVTEPTYKKWTRRMIPKRGDVILTREAPLGGVGKVRTDDQIFLGQRLYHFRADPNKLDADFLLYALMAPDLQGQIQSFGSGSTVEHMRLGDIPDLQIFAPDLGEQRRIGGILSAYDDLIENNRRRIRILEEMARALYREWFVHFRVPGDHATAGAKASGGHRLQRVDSTLGRIPDGWEVKQLSQVAHVNRAQIRPRNAPADLQYIDISSVSPGQINSITTYAFADAPGRARRVVQHGDVLWSCVRPNRRSHSLVMHPVEDTIASTGFAVLTATKVPFTFLYFATTTDDFVSFLTNNATGSAYPAVTAKTFEDARLLIPAAPLLHHFGEVTTPMMEQAHTLQRQVANLRRTRDLLLPRLLSGQIPLEPA